jgi:hypothetical protein
MDEFHPSVARNRERERERERESVVSSGLHGMAGRWQRKLTSPSLKQVIYYRMKNWQSSRKKRKREWDGRRRRRRRESGKKVITVPCETTFSHVL